MATWLNGSFLKGQYCDVMERGCQDRDALVWLVLMQEERLEGVCDHGL